MAKKHEKDGEQVREVVVGLKIVGWVGESEDASEEGEDATEQLKYANEELKYDNEELNKANEEGIVFTYKHELQKLPTNQKLKKSRKTKIRQQQNERIFAYVPTRESSRRCNEYAYESLRYKSRLAASTKTGPFFNV